MKLLRLSILLVFLCLPGLLPAENPLREPPGRRDNRDMAIVVNFPEKPILIPQYRSFWNFWAHVFDFNKDNYANVGHTGVILVDGTTGDLSYYDFGRYDDRRDQMGPRPEFYGTVRSARHVPELKLKIKARLENGWISNLDTVLVHLGAKKFFRSYGAIHTAIVYNLDLKRMVAKATEVEDQQFLFYGAPTHMYCTRFVREVIRAGGGTFGYTVFTGTQTVKHVRRKWRQE